MFWVSLLLVPFSIGPIETAEIQIKSTAYNNFKKSVIDNNENMLHNFDVDEIILTTTSLPMARHKMAVRPINESVKQKVTISPPDNNNYDSMKRAFDTVNEKMDSYTAFSANEMSFLTAKLNNLNDKLNSVEILHHEFDEVISHLNTVEQKLHVIQGAIFGSQSMNAKLDRLEISMQQMHIRIDELMEKQRKLTPPIDQAKRNKHNDDEVPSRDELLINCESKIEQLVAFIHSFAELNRLESTDILNRLGNMQSQLIQFFDVKGLITNQVNQRAIDDTKESTFSTVQSISQKSSQLIDANMSNDAIDTDFSNGYVNESTKMPSSTLNLSDNKKISFSNTKSHRKRKRTASSGNRSKQNKRPKALQLINNGIHAFSFASSVQDFPISNHSKLDQDNSNADVEIDSGIIRRNQTSAKYGMPSQNGCHKFTNLDRDDGIYRFVNPDGSGTERLCSFDTNGSAWTVIQSRGHLINALLPENFNRSWNDYKYGFGNLSGEFWYGNDFMHKLTYDDDMELKIKLQSWNDQHNEFVYDTFRVDSEENRYNLFIGGFRQGDRKLDALQYHHNQDFSTFDRQNDKSGFNDDVRCCSCAKSYASGWWFNNCIEANLNGVYRFSPLNNNYIGIIWENWLGDYSMKATAMMIRPKINWSNKNESEDYDGAASKKPPDEP